MDVAYTAAAMSYDDGSVRGDLNRAYREVEHALLRFQGGANLHSKGRVEGNEPLRATGERLEQYWLQAFDRSAAAVVEASQALGEPVPRQIGQAAERHYERQSERARALLGRIAEVVGEHADNVIRQRADGVVADYAAQDRVTKDLLRWASDAAVTHVENGRWGRDPDRTPIEIESAVLDTYQAYIYKRPAPTSRATVQERHHHLERTGSFEYQR